VGTSTFLVLLDQWGPWILISSGTVTGFFPDWEPPGLKDYQRLLPGISASTWQVVRSAIGPKFKRSLFHPALAPLPGCNPVNDY
jgi:hypothetical protein